MSKSQTILREAISFICIFDSLILASSYINSRPRIFTYNVGSPLNIVKRLYGYGMWRDAPKMEEARYSLQKPLTLRINEPEEWLMRSVRWSRSTHRNLVGVTTFLLYSDVRPAVFFQTGAVDVSFVNYFLYSCSVLQPVFPSYFFSFFYIFPLLLLLYVIFCH